MLVWSPNHCVSDAKREWGGPRQAQSWEQGSSPALEVGC